MSVSLVGKKVRLTGAFWDGVPCWDGARFPAKGEVLDVVADHSTPGDGHDCDVHVVVDGHEWSVWLTPGDFMGGVIVDE
jgi:hypothetical protein